LLLIISVQEKILIKKKFGSEKVCYNIDAGTDLDICEYFHLFRKITFLQIANPLPHYCFPDDHHDRIKKTLRVSVSLTKACNFYESCITSVNIKHDMET
jgi:hypothetical protein